MKNLETEYRNSCQEETPDLWNRIETALPEKTPPMPTRTSKKKIVSFTRFAKAAAAILVLALVVPGACFLMTQGKGGAQNDCAAMDTAGNSASMDMMADYRLTAADAAAPEEMLNDEENESVQNQTSQFDTTTDSGMQEVGANVENSETMSGQADGATMTEDIADEESLSDAVEQSPAEDNLQAETVPVEESAFMTVDEIVRDHGRTFYYLSDESGTIYIAVWKMADLSTEHIGTGENDALGEIAPKELQVGESYYFTMQEAVGKDWDYEILGVE